MTNIVTFPCEYLAFSSGYDYRLLEPHNIKAFEDFCAEKGVIPTGIFQANYGTDPYISSIPVRDGRIVLDTIPTQEEQTKASELTRQLIQSKLANRGCIIFRVGSFDNATKVFLSMKELEYCGMYDLMDIKFSSNEQGMIDVVFVSVDAESG